MAFKTVINVLLNRESYMSAHVLLNLSKEFGKRDKMWGLPSILMCVFFCNKFNKFNNTVSMNVRFYVSYGIKITLKLHFWVKTLR